MIDSKFGRKDHRSIPATAIERRLEPLDIRSNQKKKSTCERNYERTKCRSSQDYKIIDLEMIYNFLSLNYYC
jgi:hypothetical protein